MGVGQLGLVKERLEQKLEISERVSQANTWQRAILAERTAVKILVQT